MLRLICLCFLVLYHLSIFAQEPLLYEDLDICFEKALFHDHYEQVKLRLPIYTGKESKPAHTKKRRLQLDPARKEWVSISPGRRELQDIEAKILNVLEVQDTLLQKDFEWQTFEMQILAHKGGYTQEVEMLCETDTQVQQLIIEALQAQAIPATEQDWQQQLTSYQKRNGLPTGNVNIETMYALDLILED